MHYDLGLSGLGLLIVTAIGFGVVAQLVAGRAGGPWMWLIGAVAWFAGGLVASEGIWGRATVQELQPMIDGLLLDEAMLGGFVLGVPTVLVTWFLARRPAVHRPASP
jgi:hypothetical protein